MMCIFSVSGGGKGGGREEGRGASAGIRFLQHIKMLEKHRGGGIHKENHQRRVMSVTYMMVPMTIVVAYEVTFPWIKEALGENTGKEIK